MFKNQLQEMAQKSCYNLPSYACIREGPDHAPKFKASVNYNGEIFESPGYFANLRLAEHAAAEVALNAIKSRSPSQSLAKVLDESGVCKNLLQENAQRGGVPLPTYNTRRSGPGHQPVFTCTVEVAGMQFTGDAAKTKKQAEKNAALAAWSSLRKLAGRRYSAPVEDSDVTDEQEQTLIARILRDAFHATQVKSSPAALSENQHHAAGVSPALLPSTPLFSRQRASLAREAKDDRARQAQGTPSASQTGGSSSGPTGPLYKPRHLSIGRSSAPPTGAFASPTQQQQAMQGQLQYSDLQLPGNIPGANFNAQFPRLVHSSPQVDGRGGGGYAMRGTMHNSTHNSPHSMPVFPTEPLLSHAMPSIPGLGMPSMSGASGHSSPFQAPSAPTSNHTSLAIRPGMAYQPRHMRPQFNGAAEMGWNPQGIVGPSHAQGLDTRGSPSSNGPRASLWNEGGNGWGMPGNARQCAGSMVNLRVGVPAMMATGGGQHQHQHQSGPAAPQTVGKQEEEEGVEDKQVEDTTRRMLSHLCL